MDIRFRDIAPGYYFNHKAMRNDLVMLEEALKNILDFSKSKQKDIHDYFCFFEERLVGHHTIEDNHFFPHMKQDVPTVKEELDTLHTEHMDLDKLSPKVKEAFKQLLRETNEQHAKALQTAFSNLKTALSDHLDHEEKSLEAFTFGDVDRSEYVHNMDADLFKKVSPEEKKHMTSGLAWLANSMTKKEQDAFFKGLPFFVKPLYKLVLKKKFDQRVAVFTRGTGR